MEIKWVTYHRCYKPEVILIVQILREAGIQTRNHTKKGLEHFMFTVLFWGE